jgi:hypothetical protein
MTRPRARNQKYGTLIQAFLTRTTLKRDDVAAKIGVTVKELWHQGRGLVPLHANAIERTRAVLNIPKAEMDAALRSGPDAETLEAFTWSRENFMELSKRAREYYSQLPNILAEFPVITTKEWILDKPISLKTVDAQLKWVATEPAIKDQEVAKFGGSRYVDLIRRIAPEITVKDNSCYRLLAVTGDSVPQLTFCPTRYATFVNTSESASFEWGEWYFRNQSALAAGKLPPASALPIRGGPTQIVDLRSRSCVTGVVAFLLLKNTPTGDHFFVHERNAQHLLEDPVGWHLVPGGTFQPNTAEGVNPETDFSLQNTVLREFGEELLGIDELEEPQKDIHLRDVFGSPRYAPYLAAIERGSVQFFYMGLGFSSMSLKPSFYTALVIDASSLPREAIEFQSNWEGDYHPVKLSQLKSWDSDPRMQAQPGVCLKLAHKHIEFLYQSTD